MRVLRRRWTAALLAAGLALLAGCSSVGTAGPAAGGGEGAAPVDSAGSEMATAPTILRPDANGEIRLVAKPARLEVAPGVEKEVWAYNGSVPGPEIRVKQGETIRVRFKNELPVPTTIHWHGYPVPNEMDGVPGVTQNLVKPGEEFVYEFKATVAGTYMYHSHQESAEQVDMGLYGALVVEEPESAYDRDFALILDEWTKAGESNAEPAGTGMDHGSMGGMSGPSSQGTEAQGMQGMQGMQG
ncbi:MAG: copper oxidase, partial [Bacillota bacterium]